MNYRSDPRAHAARRRSRKLIPSWTIGACFAKQLHALDIARKFFRNVNAEYYGPWLAMDLRREHKAQHARELMYSRACCSPLDALVRAEQRLAGAA